MVLRCCKGLIPCSFIYYIFSLLSFGIHSLLTKKIKIVTWRKKKKTGFSNWHDNMHLGLLKEFYLFIYFLSSPLAFMFES